MLVEILPTSGINMAVPTFKDYLAGPTQAPVSNKQNTVSKSKTPSFGEFLASQPVVEPKKTTLQKVGGVAKDVAKAIVKPVATTLARPIQLGAEALGVTDQKVNEYTKRIAGDWIAPTPQNTSDVIKDIGRAAQTVALPLAGATLVGKAGLGAKIAAEAGINAVAGAGMALEQGGSETTGKELLKQTAIGAGVGAAFPVVGAGISKAFGKTASKVAETAIEDVVPSATETVSRQLPVQILPPIVRRGTAPSKFNKPTDTVSGLFPEKKIAPEPYIPDSELPVIQANGREPSVNKMVDEVPVVSSEASPLTKVDTPEYASSVKARANKLAKDPEFASSNNESVIRNFDEKVYNKPIDNQIDYAVGRDPNIIPEVPRTAALKLLREDVINNPKRYTPKQISRLTSNYATSAAGKELQASQVAGKAIIDNPFDVITLANKTLQDKAEVRRITKNTIKRFLDDIGCTL